MSSPDKQIDFIQLGDHSFVYHIKAGMTPEQFRAVTSAAMAKAKEDPDNVVWVKFEPGVYTVLLGDEVVGDKAQMFYSKDIPWIRLGTLADKIIKLYPPKELTHEEKYERTKELF